MKLKFLVSVFVFLLAAAIQGISIQAPALRTAAASLQPANIAGRWAVKFTLSGVGERKLVFEPQAKGSGTLFMSDPSQDNKQVSTPATWSETSNDRVNFSGEVELQLNCCRETGTLIFKGKLNSKDSISGKAIFVGTTVNDENFNGFVSTVGTFTASRVLN